MTLTQRAILNPQENAFHEREAEATRHQPQMPMSRIARKDGIEAFEGLSDVLQARQQLLRAKLTRPSHTAQLNMGKDSASACAIYLQLLLSAPTFSSCLQLAHSTRTQQPCWSL